MKATHKTRTLNYLKEFGSITSLEAIRDLGNTRLADTIFRLRNLNKRRQNIISYAMDRHKVTKVELAEALGMSYPTMLTKLKSTGDFKLKEADNLCSYLNIELTEFITLKK